MHLAHFGFFRIGFLVICFVCCPIKIEGSFEEAPVHSPVHAGVLALIDRNFQGFGKELFTDAGLSFPAPLLSLLLSEEVQGRGVCAGIVQNHVCSTCASSAMPNIKSCISAGKYVVHFGESPAAAAEHTANTIAAAHPDKPRPPVSSTSSREKAELRQNVFSTIAAAPSDKPRPPVSNTLKQ